MYGIRVKFAGVTVYENDAEIPSSSTRPSWT
jgi:hypothetical protein